jgi:hypothetical protein
MKALISLLLIVFAVAIVVAGFYTGIWLMLIGGIVQCIDAIKSNPTDAHMMAVGVVKIIFFEVPCIVGCVLGFSCFGAGVASA